MRPEETTDRRVVARLRRPSAGVVEVCWFSAIALLTAGPLLGAGYLLLLDFPSGPEFPRVPGGPTNLHTAFPLLVVHDLLGDIHDYLPDKLFLLGPVLVGGTGMARLARRRLGAGPLPALFAGTLYVLNPFVLDRYLSGHLYFLAGYALLPWALGAVWALAARPSTRAAVVAGAWLGVLAAVSVHVAGAYAVLVVGGIAASRGGGARAKAAAGATTLSIAALLSAYWVLPLTLDSPQAVLPADLETFASRPAGLAVFPALLALEGFWRDEFPRATAGTPTLYLAVVPIVALAALGAAALARRRRAVAAALCLAALLGVGFAASTAVAPSAARWAVERIPPLGAYREPQKLLLLTVAAYALLGAAGLEALARLAPRLSATLAVAALACVAVYGHAQLWGFGGRVELSRYPSSWSAAERTMVERGGGSLLVVPWRLYAVWSFSGGRLVANPARSFFPGRVLVPDGGEEGRARDATSRALERVMARRSRVDRLGRLLAPLDVRFVAWTREADWWRYGALFRQRDLVPIFRDARLVVFENTAWRPRGG